MSEYLLLEFVKIFNWTEKTPELRVVATLTNNAQILLDKTVKGEMQEDSLRFRLSLRVQMGRPGQNVLKALISVASADDEWLGEVLGYR